ncbi:MAG TPA: glycoside hydrolase family 3 C-terminal domain-containing protein [Streptosporangiaceae bacterium]|nr:glycoside hydrolase family 3 C-terminal domain-containing protein [Streptosporangiaceae bacterium]
MRYRGRRLLLTALVTAVAVAVVPGAVAVAAPSGGGSAGRLATCPWLNPLVSLQQRVNELVSAMSLAQEISLMQPVKGYPYTGYEHYVPGIPALCVPAVMQQDGAAGVASGATGVTQLPAPIAAAATFSGSVLNQYGSVVGSEMRGKGIGFGLAPTLNLDRVPQWGRSYETLGEDPYLTTQLGDAEIGGIQNQGVIAEVKHYAEYNQETNRESAQNAQNVIVSTRAAQETELSVFGSAVRDAQAGAVMCAMPAINGTGACENSWLLGVLRNQYGFKGDIRSDNPPSVTSDAKAANASLDQAVAPAFSASSLLAAVASGSVSRATINNAAAQILYPMFQMGLFDNPPSGSLSSNVSTGGHVWFAQTTAEQGTVLLRNANGALPLGAHGLSSIAVIGADANAYAESSGGGGGQVTAKNVVTPLSAIKNRAGSGVKVTYSMGSGPYDAFPDIPSANLTPDQGEGNGITTDIYANADLAGKPLIQRTEPTVDLESSSSSPLPSGSPSSVWSEQWTGTLHPTTTGTYQFSMTCDRSCELLVNGTRIIDNNGASDLITHHTSTGRIGLTAGQAVRIKVTYAQTWEGSGKQKLGTIAQLGWLPPGSTPPSVAAAAAAAKSAQAAVVFAGTFESEGFDQPNLSLSGVDDQLIAAVAAANPNTIVVLNTGGPVLMPWLNNVAGVLEAWYPGQQDGSAISAVLFGDANPGGKLPVTFPATASQPLSADSSRFPGNGGSVNYSEGLDIGYKWYDAHGLTPMFPFGFGLSYTTFGFSGLSVQTVAGSADPSGHPGQVVATVKATVTNTGSRAGAEVAQLYLGDPASAGEPARQLRGFQRVQLNPGQSTVVTFQLTAQDLAYWNNGWTAAPGGYQVWVGDSSALSGLPLTGSFQL